MDDAILQRVCNLATAFRQSAHLLLDQQYKLSLDTWSLGEIQEAFCLILEIEQHTNFHVLPPNHRQHSAIPHLQFIYDLLQKIYGLRLWAKVGQSLPQNETISLRCFRNLQALELLHIPVTSLKALQTLRPTLRSVIIVKGLTRLGDLFIRCGADKAGEFAWEQLQEAVLAHNSLYSLDHSLSLLPNLKILDLSHCELEDASALEYLPTVSLLDLSHNQLRLLPRLSPTATYSLIVLIANNNLFSHISGLHEMNNIEELDLRDNVLSMKEVLSPIGALPHIRVLKISGNPITWDLNYRSQIIRQLNPATANHKVVFDDVPLTGQEYDEVGVRAVPAGSSYSPELLSSLSSLSSLCSPVNPLSPAPGLISQPLYSPEEADLIQLDSVDSQPASLVYDSAPISLKNSGNGHPRRKSKKKRTRHIAITDPDNEDMDNDSIHLADSDMLERMGVPDPPPPSLAAGPTFTLPTSESFTQALNAHTLKTDMRNPAPEQSDKLLEEILQSKPHSGTPGAQCDMTNLVNMAINETSSQDEMVNTNKKDVVVCIPSDQNDKESSPEENPSTSDITEAKTSDEPSTESSMESSFYKGSSNISRRSSADMSPPHSDSDDEKDEVLAQREMEDQGGEEGDAQDGKSLHDVILAVTPLYFKEKHSITTATLFRWELRCVESVELLSMSPHKILITFDTIRPAYRTRTYILDPPDHQSLMQILTPVLERNALQEMLHSAMKCVKCDAQFSRDLAVQSDGSNTLKCPNCGGGVVVRVERVDQPAVSSSAMYEASGPFCSTPLDQTLVNKSGALASAPPAGTDSGSCLGESSESVSVCSEASSCVRRESDVEVISNPSVSSIEVLNDQHVIHEGEGDGEKPLVSAVVNTDACTPANSPSINQKPEPTTCMQESSSSGSMTGSVCTTYEKTGSLPTSPLKAILQQHSHLDTVDSKSNSKDISSDMSSALYQTAESSLQVTVPGTSPCSLGNSPHLSSSSASIDTIKNGATTPGLHHKAVMTSVQGEKAINEAGGKQRSISSWVQSLLHTLTGYYWLWWEEVEEVEGIERISNPIRYTYEDFADVDHRLKLYCEVLLFHEPGEQLLGLVKAVLLIKGGRREFQGLLVISNKKLYILEIVAQEDDSPQAWLELCSSYNLSNVGTIHSLYQRQGLALSLGDTILMISLADSHRANCFFNFFSELLDECGINPSIGECSPSQEEVLIQHIQEAVESTGEETTPSIFAIVSLLLDGGCSESQFLAITETDLLLFYADLEWYLPPTPESKLQLNLAQKISDITAIEVHSESHVALQFMDEVTGSETSWDLHVASSVAACHIIQAIRTPWTQLFSVDLQVTYHKCSKNQTLRVA